MPYDHNSARLALGCMMIQPSLCLSDKYPIDRSDFSQSQFHLRLFQAIHALARKGCGTVTAMDCYNLCKNNAEVKNLFDTNDCLVSLTPLSNWPCLITTNYIGKALERRRY